MSELTYIAGPFFTAEQKEIVQTIEDLLDHRGDSYFSPREYGVIVDEDTPMNPARTKRIFDMNVRMIRESTTLVAITDNFDPGTMFEMGMFYMKPKAPIGTKRYGKETPIITYSPMGYGANVMIAHATWTHCRAMTELEHALNGHQIDPMEAIE